MTRPHVAAARIAVALLSVGLLGVGCSDDSADPFTSSVASTTTRAARATTTTAPTTTTTTAPSTTAPTTTTAPATTAAPPPSPATTPAPAPVADVRIGLQPVATADAPTAMATRAGTTNLYIAEKKGRVRVLDPANGTIGVPIIDISSEVSANGERGLLGIAFSPDGGRLYLSYTNLAGDNRLEELVMNGDAPDLATRRTLLAVEKPAPNHNGGDIKFGPDGMLWYGLGDGGGAGDPFGNAQNVDTLLGSILRIDVNGRGAGEYSIPPDNPFAAGGGRPEIWLYGVRNPWRFTFDRETGDLWIGDVGQNAVEEVDVLRAPDRGRGANLQWPLREGFRRYSGDAPPGSVGPIHEYGRSDGSCSITGGYVYRGQAVPALRGVYIFGDYCEGTVRGLFTTLAGVESRGLGAVQSNLSSFGEDTSGELYVLSLDGSISRIVAA